MTFTPLGLRSEARCDETLLDVARSAGAPLGNACGGVGVCARCRVHVLEGAGNLSEPTSVEIRFSRGFAEGDRMACQAVVHGNVTVTTTYW